MIDYGDYDFFSAMRPFWALNDWEGNTQIGYGQLRLLRDSEGNPIDIIGNWIDINDHKQTEALLQESEKKYKGVVETLPVLICTFSPNNGKVRFVNNVYCEYFKKTKTLVA